MKLELNDIRMDSESGIQIGHTHNAYTHVSQPVEGVQHAGWMKGYTALAAALVGFAMLGTVGLVAFGGPLWLAVTLSQTTCPPRSDTALKTHSSPKETFTLKNESS